MVSDDSRTASEYADMSVAVAVRALDALESVGGTAFLAGLLDDCVDRQAALAGVRIAGPDVFAPNVLRGHTIDARDADTVAQSLSVFPPVRTPATTDEHIVAWQEWGTTGLLARSGHTDWERPLAGPDSHEDVHAVLGDPRDWQHWSQRLAQLSPLALPGLDSPVHLLARREALAVARGTARAMLRRDYVTAARLVRWLALLQATGTAVPLDPTSVIEHMSLVGGNGARMVLNLAIARDLVNPT